MYMLASKIGTHIPLTLIKVRGQIGPTPRHFFCFTENGLKQRLQTLGVFLGIHWGIFLKKKLRIFLSCTGASLRPDFGGQVRCIFADSRFLASWRQITRYKGIQRMQRSAYTLCVDVFCVIVKINENLDSAHPAMPLWRDVKITPLDGMPEYAYAQMKNLIQSASKTYNQHNLP